MTFKYKGETVTYVSSNASNNVVSITYIDSTGKLITKTEPIDWTQKIIIGTEAVI